MGMNIYIELIDGDAPGFSDIVEDANNWFDDTPATATSVTIGVVGCRHPLAEAVLLQDREWKDGIYEGGYREFMYLLDDSLSKVPELVAAHVEDTDTDEAIKLVTEGIFNLTHEVELLSETFANKQIFMNMH